MNPTRLIPCHLSRPPSVAEIKFGHGCRHYYGETVMLAPSRRWVKIDGVRWMVMR